MSWFWRGFQSAIFYYVSCAPCTKLNYRRKQRIKNKRARAEKEDQENNQPDLYTHPSPFSTNIYWREEMALGPGPPPKKKDRDKIKNGSSRELNTGGQGSSAGGSSADTTLVVESLDALKVVVERDSGEGWNRRRYQRPDEILWGFDHDGEESGIGMSGISRSGTAGSGTQYTARNPAVNDLHPPVVSTHPTRKSETRWMLQPPPSAKVMEGKERANRSRSVSGGSYGSSKAVSLGRQVGERLTNPNPKRTKKISNSDLPLLEIPLRNLPSHSNPGPSEPPLATDPQGQRHDRDPRTSSDSRNSESSYRQKRPPPIMVSEDATKRPPDIIIEPNNHVPPPRPPLSTIVSSSNTVPTAQTHTHTRASNPLNTNTTAAESPAPNQIISPPAGLRPLISTLSSSQSLQVLQELIAPSSALNMRTLSPTPSSPQAAGIRLPPATKNEERVLRLPERESLWRDAGGTAFELPRERSGEEGRGEGMAERWSMDI